MTPQETAKKLIEFYQTYGWHQGHMYMDSRGFQICLSTEDAKQYMKLGEVTSFCLIAACNILDIDIKDRSRLALALSIRPGHLSRFNDDPETTRETFFKALEKVAEMP